MRGTHVLPSHGLERGGIIPAYAGNTSTGPRRTHRPRDHPRVCGEHCVVGGELGDEPGIIPAYAGNTLL